MASSPQLSSEADYVWEVATLFPEQGGWTEEQNLDLTDHANRGIEFTDGRLSFLPMPTELHQELIAFLYRARPKVETVGNDNDRADRTNTCRTIWYTSNR